MPTGLVANAISKIVGRRPELSSTGGTAHARFITNYCPVVAFGLVGKIMHASTSACRWAIGVR